MRTPVLDASSAAALADLLGPATAGDLVVLRGGAAAGKSVLLRHLAATLHGHRLLLDYSNASVAVDGVDVVNRKPYGTLADDLQAVPHDVAVVLVDDAHTGPAHGLTGDPLRALARFAQERQALVIATAPLDAVGGTPDSVARTVITLECDGSDGARAAVTQDRSRPTGTPVPVRWRQPV
jgi:hypothetical protein